MKHFLFLLFFGVSIVCFPQFSGLNSNGQVQNTNTPSDEITVKISGKTKYTDYKIISIKNDTTFVDTTLTIKKDYKFNYRRKDNFELLEFHNQGQTFTTLGYDFSDTSLSPDIGFRGKQFLYMEVDDINYYHVPTPTTQISVRTGLEQGQVLDAIFTLNFSERLNASIAYKGLRSLGQYRESLSSTGNFRSTLTYRTPEDQYRLRLHITSQDALNQESGGIADIDNFESNDPNFQNRAVIDVNLDDTETDFKGTRVYIDHTYKIFSSKDSTNQKDFSNLKVGHIFKTESKSYNFNQDLANTSFFGNSFNTGAVNEKVEYSLTNNQAYLEFNSKYILGKFKAKANYTSVSYGYDSIYNPNAGINKTKLTGNAVSLGGEWKGKIGKFQIDADATITPGRGYLAGNYLNAQALYKQDSLITIKGNLLVSSKAPNFNFLLFNSAYDAYNWDNDFDNINTRNLGLDVNSKWGNASLNLTNIENYTYFDNASQPQQHNGSIVYFKLKANKEFKYRKFSLDNTILYQQVSTGSEVFRVPDLVTRNTLYYSDHWFKGDPLQVQIGATLKYFTKYNANAYDPLLAEFNLQDDTEIGYPTVDLFFNARVRRTRIFFKVENVNSSFSSTPNYYSAPNYPYRDLVIRFGLVWNWFI